MRPVEFSQPSVDDVRARGLDLLIAACGYEERATHVPRFFGTNATNRVQLGFLEHADHPQHRRNQNILGKLGYRVMQCSGDDYDTATTALRDAMSQAKGKNVRIGVDISSMTRAWYWGLAKGMAVANEQTIEAFFFYSPAKYSPPAATFPPPKVFGPIAGLSNSLEFPDREISLLIGLGYEADKALGLMEYIAPRNTWLFYTDPGAAPAFVTAVRKANHDLFGHVDPANIIAYRYDDLAYTFAMLDSLIRGLVRESRVLIAPLGPKPFGLIAFVQSLLHDEVDIWRVSGGASAVPQKRAPLGPILVGRVQFGSFRGSLRPQARESATKLSDTR